MPTNAEQAVRALYTKRFDRPPGQTIPLPASGSNRRYFRLAHEEGTVIGAWNPDALENRAFLTLTRHFQERGLPVPAILAEDPASFCYLLEDLGNSTLFSMLPGKTGKNGLFDDEVMQLYRQAIDWLPEFQIRAADGLPFEVCYPRKAFDRQAMMWDLNYFKYYFLKYFSIPFDEQKLEDAFASFTGALLKASDHHFMYRDFQSRNIMIRNGQPWFIDYQGGRRGALQYDMASLLFDARANIPFEQRSQLLNHYLAVAGKHPDFNAENFHRHFYDFVVMRILQALGAYGFRGGVEKKSFFLQSLPYALNNLRWLAGNNLLPDHHSPYLSGLIETILRSGLPACTHKEGERLVVSIHSFSYKKGIPDDLSGHGGGFVFDCRALPNPGREEPFKRMSGLDGEVAGYLEKEEQVRVFLASAGKLVEAAIENYLKRGFRHLSVSFGCTGGQHRSVYCAEKLAARLTPMYPVIIRVMHHEKDNWPEEVNTAANNKRNT